MNDQRRKRTYVIILKLTIQQKSKHAHVQADSASLETQRIIPFSTNLVGFQTMEIRV